MTQRVRKRAFALAVIGFVTFALSASIGCQSDSPRVAESHVVEPPRTETRDEVIAPRPEPTTRPAEEVVERPATTKPATTQPAEAKAEPPVETEKKLPDFVTILRRFENGREWRLSATPQGNRRLIVESENVQRIRLDRSLIPLRKDQSIILQLDGQPIEWLVDSPVTEFERTANGAWVALPPPTSGR